jgi:hypothetical protein
MSSKPLYFLTHEGNPRMFSGYGIPIEEGTKSPLIGMMLLDRPAKCAPEYLDSIHETFGDYQIGPMTTKGDRELYTHMRIDDPLSVELLRYDLHGYEGERDERSGFEFVFGETRLPDDRLKGADSNFVVIRNGNCDRSLSQYFLHNDVASAPANFKKTMFRQNSANLFSGKDAQFTQQRPPTA